MINILGWIAGAEVLQLTPAQSTISRKLAACAVTWLVARRDRARFGVPVSGYTFIPFLLHHSCAGEAARVHIAAWQTLWHHCHKVPRSGHGGASHCPPEKRQNSVFTEVLEVRLDFFRSCWKQLFSVQLLYPSHFRANAFPANSFPKLALPVGIDSVAFLFNVQRI